MTLPHWPGRAERELARWLVAALPPRAAPALEWSGVDLRACAEHMLYAALRRGPLREAPARGSRALLRLLRAMFEAGAVGNELKVSHEPTIVVLVTQPIHVTLYEPIGGLLARRGIRSIVLDAETRHKRSVPDPRIVGRVGRHLDAMWLPGLAWHVGSVARHLAEAPSGWRGEVEPIVTRSLFDVLRRGLTLAALDAARLRTVIRRAGPRLVACFSESGILARLAPEVAHAEGILAVDLPHAEANDPFGTAGAAYDLMLVYGSHGRRALEAGGIDDTRIHEIGPLRYDPLLRTPARAPAVGPRRIVFASQPSDPVRPALTPTVKVGALRATLAIAEALSPAEVLVVPHPTEPPEEINRLLADIAVPPGVSVGMARELHAALRGAWLLVTASSQSVFDAIAIGVPAVTVQPAGAPAPVTFADEGISRAVRTMDEAAAVGAALASSGARQAMAQTQRAALGQRVGPLDGAAAERAAERLAAMVNRGAG